MISLSGNRVYLDANTIIYALEGFAQYANLQAGLPDPLDAGAFVAVTSEITLLETIVGPCKAGKVNEEAELRAFLTSRVNLIIEPVTTAVLEKAIDLRVQYGLKSPDAIHLATGILANCDLFVTRDAAGYRASDARRYNWTFGNP
jgi:predicted nucleic acid-binding protein